MPKKYYYAVVDKKTGKLYEIFTHRYWAQEAQLSDQTIVPIPASDLNQFIQQYIPVPKVDQVPGN